MNESEQPKKQKGKGTWLYRITMLVCVLVFVVSAYFLGQWLYENYQTSRLTEDLQSMVGVSDSTVNEDGVQVISPVEEDTPYYTMDLTELTERNSDTVAWVRMTGTNVNYPVVQTTDNNYYLKRDFDHNWTNSGWIFGDYRCDFSNLAANKNLIIYGHGRRDMSMFGSLEYCRRSWWLNNPDYHTIHVTTHNEESVWKVFAVYTTSVDFYYIQTQFYGGEFMNLVNEMKSRSLKDFGVEVTADDTILTLSTCTDDADRLVVNAVLVSSQPRNAAS